MKNIKQLFKCLFCFHDWEYEIIWESTAKINYLMYDELIPVKYKICKKCGKIKRYEKY